MAALVARLARTGRGMLARMLALLPLPCGRLAATLAISLIATLACKRENRTVAAVPIVSATAAASGAEGDRFPGKPVVRLCKKEWSRERCCAFLCQGLREVCADSPRSQPGIESCPTWCPTLSDKDVRCHVFHCYVSISPTGGIKDHDSHCRHASHQLPGGGCPPVVYE
jgi:hypothetical protein